MTLTALCPVHQTAQAVGACSRCGTFGCGECLAVSGADLLCAACLSRITNIPWDERATLGMWPAWWKTSLRMISSPDQLLSTARADEPLSSSLLFALLSSIVGFVPSMLCWLLMTFLAFFFQPTEVPFSAWFLPFVALFYLGAFLGFQVGGVLVFGGLEHLGLLLLGAKPKSYTVTVRARALSMGPYLLGLIPLCSLYIYPLWSLVLCVIANMHLHKTTAGKATAAVLLPLVLLCGGGLALVGAMALAVDAFR